MSNAAVVKLQRTKVDGLNVWLDDNFAESIHIHIDEFRFDLTYNEFNDLCFDICEAINELMQVDGFNLHFIDPVFFQQILRTDLYRLTAVKIESVKLSTLWIYDGRLRPLVDSHVMRGLEGDLKAANMKRKSDHINQTGYERIRLIDNSIKTNGYPYKDQYIIVYGDDNVIRDGQHRACSLYHFLGDIEVPIMRLYFQDYSYIDVEKRVSLFGEIKYRLNQYLIRIRKSKGYFYIAKKILMLIIEKLKDYLRNCRRFYYRKINSYDYIELQRIFDEK